MISNSKLIQMYEEMIFAKTRYQNMKTENDWVEQGHPRTMASPSRQVEDWLKSDYEEKFKVLQEILEDGAVIINDEILCYHAGEIAFIPLRGDQ